MVTINCVNCNKEGKAKSKGVGSDIRDAGFRIIIDTSCKFNILCPACHAKVVDLSKQICAIVKTNGICLSNLVKKEDI